jgi:hypothetical protein
MPQTFRHLWLCARERRSQRRKKIEMELVVSAVAGELVIRFMSFLFNKYKSEEQLEKKMKRLQDLVVRAHMIVEEAEVRYITNSKMLLQLKKLVEVMYQGYLVLDTIKYRTLCTSSTTESEVSNNFNELSFTTCVKRRLRTTMCTSSNINELQVTLDNLESTVSNMQEFVLLLGVRAHVPWPLRFVCLHRSLHVWSSYGKGACHQFLATRKYSPHFSGCSSNSWRQ